MKVLILKSETGKITSEKTIDGNIGDVVKQVASDALKEWNEMTSDFTIMKDTQEARIPLPLKPDVYEAVKSFLSGKDKTSAILRIPIYIISFDNMWKEDDYQDNKVYVVSYYLDDNLKNELLEYAKQATSAQKIEEQGEEEEE
ncbi:DUF2286 domain-containing protein [Acidianus brierleyi]|uniref:DUF2286 domain-containing protein n=1 Tax=Acidianus brierleyi TaxID=41673 RepID=A0A2U9IFK8_9CREN|nr:DUF2286 domain-containing protein [Acidianus brierleyi]AWR94821.1 DUF2286 domain-containing protein [Acidianus brierleyi]